MLEIPKIPDKKVKASPPTPRRSKREEASPQPPPKEGEDSHPDGDPYNPNNP